MNADESLVVQLLLRIGEDPTRGGLRETPRRFLAAWDAYTSGYNVDIAGLMKTFEDGAANYDEIVVVRDIPVYSHCEHHLAPFFGVAHVAYIPNKRIVGLSKINRLVDAFARRLQVQERITTQVADAMQEYLDPAGVGVILKCHHMCVASRGVKQPGSQTITSALHGAMKEEASARAEFMKLAQ